MSTQTVNITSQAQLKDVLTSFFMKDMTYWEGAGRAFFAINVSPAVSFNYREESNLHNNLLGQMGVGVLTLDPDTKTASLANSSIIDGARQTLTSTLTQLTTGAFSLTTNYTYLSYMAMRNMEAIKKTAAYTKALQILNVSSAPDADVANVLATAHWTCSENVPNILPSDVVLTVTQSATNEGKVKLTAELKIKGVVSTPMTLRFWVSPDPAQVPWVPIASGNLLGEYISGENGVVIDTDFRNRDNYIIMSPKNVHVVCQAQYQLSNGQVASVQSTDTFDFSSVLPVFDYFDLVQ